MKSTIFMLVASTILLLSNCSSNKESIPQGSEYFIGSWKLGAPVQPTNSFQTILTFRNDGTFELNSKAGAPPALGYLWSFDLQVNELYLQGEEYLIIERTVQQFKAQNKYTDSALLFTRQL